MALGTCLTHKGLEKCSQIQAQKQSGQLYRLRYFQSAELVLFFSLPTLEWFLFEGEIPWTILMQLHTHHSLDFIRKLKVFKVTGYIHLYYNIPFLSGIACILVSFTSLFSFFIIHRDFCFNIFSVWYKAATQVSWEVLWTKVTSPGVLLRIAVAGE